VAVRVFSTFFFPADFPPWAHFNLFWQEEAGPHGPTADFSSSTPTNPSARSGSLYKKSRILCLSRPRAHPHKMAASLRHVGMIFRLPGPSMWRPDVSLLKPSRLMNWLFGGAGYRGQAAAHLPAGIGVFGKEVPIISFCQARPKTASQIGCHKSTSAVLNVPRALLRGRNFHHRPGCGGGLRPCPNW